MTISDINAEIRSLCDADTTSYTAPDLLRRVNSMLEIIIGKILDADGTWQWDDTNYTDAPRGIGTLVEGQEAYTYASDYLQIIAMDIKDNNGFWRRIKSLDMNELGGLSPEEYFGTTSGAIITGFPLYYDLFSDDSFRLWPLPTSTNVTLASGYRVWFKRTADIFTSAQVTTGTKVPGFASPFHPLLCYMAAVPYCITYKKDRVALYEKKIEELTKDMLAFYGRREKDKRKQMTMMGIAFR